MFVVAVSDWYWLIDWLAVDHHEYGRPLAHKLSEKMTFYLNNICGNQLKIDCDHQNGRRSTGFSEVEYEICEQTHVESIYDDWQSGKFSFFFHLHRSESCVRVQPNRPYSILITNSQFTLRLISSIVLCETVMHVVRCVCCPESELYRRHFETRTAHVTHNQFRTESTNGEWARERERHNEQLGSM